MKKFTTVILLLASIASNAQNETSLLNNYNYRTKGYLGVDVLGGISGDSKNESSSVTKNNFNSFNIGFNPRIFGQYVTDKEQISYSLGLQSQFNFDQEKYGSQKMKSNNIYLQSPLNINYRRFFKKEIFVGLAFSESTFFNQSKNVDTIYTNTNKNFANNIFPSVSVGKGRVNNINPMEKVLWILRDLKSENLLQSDLSENEITDFANAIVEIENTRMFDYRKKNKFALNLLLDKIKNHVKENDLTKALNVIQDNYYFALINLRYRGEEVYAKVGIMNDYRKNNSKNIQEYKGINHYFSPQVSINYNRYKPLSLKKQIEYGAAIGIATFYSNNKTTTILNDTNIITSKNSDMYKNIFSSAYFEYGYYFSTRSNMNMGVFLRYGNPVTKYKYFSATPYFNYNYMINYRLRLKGIVQAGIYNYNDNNVVTSRNAILSANLNLYYNLR